MHGDSFGSALAQWLALHSLGRKPRTVEFNSEIHGIIIRRWPGALNATVATITVDQVIAFAERVTHYCPSRWNAMVSALRTITPHGLKLKRRPLDAKERAALSPAQFDLLLLDLDQAKRSHGGLVVRFLAQTGMRIAEARRTEWANVKGDHFSLPGSVTKNGKPRAIPFVPGIRATLRALRRVGDGVRVIPQAACQTALRSACKRAGLSSMSHHDFRHLFATRAVESEVDIPTVARWLGHTDGGALLGRRYFHLLSSHSRRMAARVVI